MAFIYALIFSGIYTIDYSLFDIGLVLAAGAVGVAMRMGFGIAVASCRARCGAGLSGRVELSPVSCTLGRRPFDFSGRSSRRGSVVGRRVVPCRFAGRTCFYGDPGEAGKRGRVRV